jgi:hypothetical protein
VDPADVDPFAKFLPFDVRSDCQIEKLPQDQWAAYKIHPIPPRTKPYPQIRHVENLHAV